MFPAEAVDKLDGMASRTFHSEVAMPAVTSVNNATTAQAALKLQQTQAKQTQAQHHQKQVAQEAVAAPAPPAKSLTKTVIGGNINTTA